MCFHVSQDGLSITEVASTCDLDAAFDSNLDGISNDGRNCKVTASCEGVWAIENGAFACVNEFGELAIGTFSSTTSVSGLAFEGEAGVGEFCSAAWIASPD